MKRPDAGTFHYPRWEIALKAFYCILLIITGSLIMALPFGTARWYGFIPIAAAVVIWELNLRKKWNYTIRENPDQLSIGSQAYSWDQFSRITLERKGQQRTLRLTRISCDKDLLINDKLINFNDLAQRCFRHILEAETTGNKTPKTPSKTTSKNSQCLY